MTLRASTTPGCAAKPSGRGASCIWRTIAAVVYSENVTKPVSQWCPPPARTYAANDDTFCRYVVTTPPPPPPGGGVVVVVVVAGPSGAVAGRRCSGVDGPPKRRPSRSSVVVGAPGLRYSPVARAAASAAGNTSPSDGRGGGPPSDGRTSAPLRPLPSRTLARAARKAALSSARRSEYRMTAGVPRRSRTRSAHSAASSAPPATPSGSQHPHAEDRQYCLGTPQQ
mmetsp:Transcript_4943/g.20217  ORF Transcript_4943/g.20217 Transcript_4943/m.20217 type:complete len:225 (-) Transcript_4943:947-1621(-)